MSGEQLRVGIVGCGGIANAHVDAYQANGGVEIVAACDVNAAAAEALAQRTGATAYTDPQAMLAEARPDAVSLLTPPAARMPLVQTLCERGVHVFCEKPLADSVAVAEQMAQAADRSGVLLLVAVCHRFHEPVRRTRELIDSGTLGEVRMFRNRFGYPWTMAEDRLRGRGGVLLDNGAHSADLFRFLVGEPTRVLARGDRTDDITLLRDCACVLEATRAIGVIELNGTVPKSKSIIEVYGTGGAAYIDYGGESVFVPADGGDAVVLTDPSLPGPHRFTREIAHFLACVRGQATPTIGAQEGIRDLQIIEAVFKSIQQGLAVEVG